MSAEQTIRWPESPGEERRARWRSVNGAPPGRVVVADDGMKADTAFRLACEGTVLLWHGDFHNARQLLDAMARRADRKQPGPGSSVTPDFHLCRQARSRRARILGMLLVPVAAGHVLPLRRAPDVRLACERAYGSSDEPYVVPLRELQGVMGAAEWRRKGVHVPALDESITPHYGVFSPVRGEYVDLVAEAPLPARSTAFDIGHGHRRPRRRAGPARCPAGAGDGLRRAGPRLQPYAPRLPRRTPGAPGAGREGWLIISDLAEHLGLRPRTELPALFAEAGLTVLDRLDTRPRHPRAGNRDDPLHAARRAEVTSLWRLTATTP